MQKITVQGVEYDLELTVGAFAEISEACPNGDFSRIDELFQLPPGKSNAGGRKDAGSHEPGCGGEETL